MERKYLKNFLQRCNALNLQNSTIEQYKSVIENFFDFIDIYDLKDIENIRETHIMEFLVSKKNKVRKITVKGYFVILKVFFNYLYHENFISHNIMGNMKKPKVPKYKVKVFSNEEIKLILNYFDKSTFIGFRNYAIMCILFSTGMRKGELCNMYCTDIMFESGVINIIGKGDKQRHIPISPTLRKILLKYFKMRNEYIVNKGLLQNKFFIISKTGNKMQPDNVTLIFYTIKNSYKIQSDRFSAHTFRHTFAKTYLLNGGDIFSLQKILGHEKIETTRQYINLNETEIKIQNEKYNPLDNTRWQYY